MRLLAGAIGLLLAACASAPSGQWARASLPSAIEALNEAYRTADVAVLETLITSDYAHTNGASAPIGREEWLAWNRLRAERQASGAWRTDSYVADGVEVRRLGDVAVVTGVVRSSGVRDGAPSQVAVRFTALWVVENNQWRRAAFHDAPLPAS